MADKILCPWCGTEMLYPEPWSYVSVSGGVIWRIRAKCPKCYALSPYGFGHTGGEAKKNFIANALRRYTPPVKPLTLDELQACDDDRPLFNECKGCDSLFRVWGNIAKIECQGYYSKREYGTEYRYWPDRKPTKEEREAAEWLKQ